MGLPGQVIERHWHVESIKVKIEDKTGVKVQYQKLMIGNEILLDGKKLTDYPAVTNMGTLTLIDETPKPKKQVLPEEQKKKKMKADSVL
jgi:hypothetical protein